MLCKQDLRLFVSVCLEFSFAFKALLFNMRSLYWQLSKENILHIKALMALHNIYVYKMAPPQLAKVLPEPKVLLDQFVKTLPDVKQKQIGTC